MARGSGCGQLNPLLRHGHLLSMLGVKQVIALVNKMDLVNYSQQVYQEVVEEYSTSLDKLGIRPLAYIPVSGRFGDNIADRSAMAWYQGATVLEALDELHVEPLLVDNPVRMPVQGVQLQQGNQRRVITGTVEYGTLRVGDEVVFYPSGKRARVQSIEGLSEQKLMVQAGHTAGLTLDEQIYVSRGELLAKGNEPKPKVSHRIRVNLFWLGRKLMNAEKTYFLKLGTTKVRVKLEDILRNYEASVMDPREGGESSEIYYAMECILKCDKPLAFDISAEMLITRRFVIVDDYDLAGGGTILEGLDEKNLYWHSTAVNRAAREHLNGHQAGVLWFTGLSGSGKSTLANALEKRLAALGARTYLLDGDNVRYGLNQDLGFNKSDRAENIRRIAEVSKLFTDAGMFVLTAFISPYEADRQLAREIIGSDDFLEIHVHCSLEECERRDPKGVYVKARRGEIPHFTGISDPYEVPQNPDIIVSTEQENVEVAVERILLVLKLKDLI